MSTLHISGLTSGNDYQSMVDQLMKVRRVPIDSLETKQQEADYDLGAWADVNTHATALAGVLDQLRSYALWHNMAVGSSYGNVATASAASGTAEQQYTVAVSHLATAQSISSDLVDTSSDLIANGYAGAGDAFTIEGQQVTIEAGETLVSLRTKINSAALAMDESVRVRASIVDRHLVLTREKTGAGSIALSDTTGSVLQSLGVLDASAAIRNENTSGQDALFSVNGIEVARSTNTNLTDVVDGLTINLKAAGTTVLGVEPDRGAVKAAILDFVDKYNTLASMATDASKIAMGSSSGLAQKGELYGDSLINSIRLGLRDQVTAAKGAALTEQNAAYTYNGMDGVMDSLSDLGIWTTGQANKLEIVDETRLDDMLENQFDKVEQLFKGTYDDQAVAYTNGVASDFYRYMNKLSEPLTGDIARRVQSLTDHYDDLGTKISDMQNALSDYEQKLWDEFTRMEDALTAMNSQLDYIKAMFFQSSKN